MSAMKRGRRDGLVLLIVLGMLSLLSLLAVTYVVFSGQSRSASLALIRRDFHETPSDRLLDEAFHQVLRGTTDTQSVAWTNDMLADLYGSRSGVADAPVFLTARFYDSNSSTILRDNPERVKAYKYTVPSNMNSYDTSNPEGPELYGSNQFLKIPIAWPSGTMTPTANVDIPEQNDAWNGRVITFLAGPLANQSLRIVRYVGEVGLIPGSAGGSPALDPDRANLQYSITVDLSDLRETLSTVGFSSGGSSTRTTSQWITAEPQGRALLYEKPKSLELPYPFMVNSGVLNSHGLGLQLNGTPDTANFSGPLSGTIPDAYLANRAQSRLDNSSYVPSGDTDESYDAADYQNFWLAMKQLAVTGSEPSDDIIPSFHRPAVIHYLAKLAPDLSSINANDPVQQARFVDFLDAVRRASGRPISYNIKKWPGGTLVRNPGFSGSNGLDFKSGSSGSRAPQLVIDWSKLPDPAEQDKFQAWLRFLTRGPWDVDNDGDGVRDSVWVDLNFPLMTSPEGKLLKLMTAFYIEDMDSRLDINAAGNTTQASDASQGQVMSSNKYAYSQTNPSATGHWPQGVGVGPGEISLRPLFTSDVEYDAVLDRRYSSNDASDDQPGAVNTDDMRSAMLERNRLNEPIAPAGYPLSTFPLAVRGHAGLGLDLLGNPMLVESVGFGETTDDPYEASVLFGNRNDRNITFAEYERLARVNDLDRVATPRRLQSAALTAFTPSASGYFDRLRSMSPRNSALTLPRFAGTYQYPRAGVATAVTRRVASFVEFVEAYAQNKQPGIISPPPTAYFTNEALARLFPIEFMQNLPLNLNRPLGNGKDDDGDTLIDEADEVVNGQTAVYQGVTASDEYIRDTYGYDLELENEAAGVKNMYGGNQAKQLLARHLYCLAQLILPAEYRFPSQPDPTKAITPAERARILAQWAVNVVDFRDPDSAMTRFAYDATPFQAKTPPGSPPGTLVYWLPADGVVWGVEQADLVMTETLAFHNLNIRNQPNPPPGSTPTEQLRVPEGSLFMEFLCPRVTTPSSASTFDGTVPPAMAGLYTVNNNELKLNLGATATDGTNVFPVWRVAFLQPTLKPSTSTNEHQDSFTQVYENTDPAKRFAYSYQVQNDAAGLKWLVGTDSTAVADPKIDRVMWFANVDPTVNNHGLPSAVTNPQDKVFRFKAGTNMLHGGQYLVVGPREFTYLGSKVQTGAPHRMPSNHRFQLTNNWLQMWNQENEPAMWAAGTATPLVANNKATTAPNAPFAAKVRDCVTMTAGMALPDDWTDPDLAQKFIGLNVSEPTRDSYYTVPDQYLNSSDTTDPSDPENNADSFKTFGKDAYFDLASSPGTGTSHPPMDKGANGYLSKNNWDDPANNKDYPEIKTERNWTAAVLQRLADPLRAYHEKYNPYITVDWMSVDLTVFSGEETLPNNKDIYLASRHKTGAMLLPNQPFARANTGSNPPLAGSTFYSYHSELKNTPSTKVTPTAQVHFSYELEAEYYAATSPVAQTRSGIAQFSTLGYLNPQFVIRGTATSQTPALPATDDYEYQAYFLGAPGPNAWAIQEPPMPDQTLKAPLAPYFPNRDFANAYELTSVPLSSPGQFFQEFSVQPKASSPPVPVFNYTMDFEDLYLPVVNPPGTAAAGQERSSAIFLECVDVPSPWVDSWKVANPTAVSGGVTVSQTMLFENYRAPYNAIPTFREPGKINLNTVSEPTVLRGLMWNIMTPTTFANRSTATIPFSNNLILERRGYATQNSSIVTPNPHLDNGSPTEFARLFTSPLAPNKFPEVVQQTNRASDVSLLRRRQLTDGKRLFDVAETGVFPDGDPAANTPSAWAYSTAIPLNSYTHNFPAARMANLTTDRSNVFAVRMTIAYFEYDAASGLGAEYGADQGRSKRHRAYYMVDRSIPVGYRSGYDLNTEQCVLVRSIIE